MTARTSLAALLLAGASFAVVSAQAQDYRYDNRYSADYRTPPTYAAQPYPAQPAPVSPPPVVYQDNARVTRVMPRIEQVSMPQEECHMEMERVAAPPQNAQGQNIGGAIIGGIAGGLLGNQVGGGNGRAAATAIGAVGGALVGQNVAGNMNNSQVPPGPIERQVRRCNVVNRVVERNAGYDVSYVYNGHTFSTVMPADPGTSLRVNVSVSPAY
jgi:uncharacterized protein YcfJ